MTIRRLATNVEYRTLSGLFGIRKSTKVLRHTCGVAQAAEAIGGVQIEVHPNITIVMDATLLSCKSW